VVKDPATPHSALGCRNVQLGTVALLREVPLVKKHYRTCHHDQSDVLILRLQRGASSSPQRSCMLERVGFLMQEEDMGKLGNNHPVKRRSTVGHPTSTGAGPQRRGISPPNSVARNPREPGGHSRSGFSRIRRTRKRQDHPCQRCRGNAR